MSSDWTRPFEPDEHTVALYHFDEGEGDLAHDACGDGELTLRAHGKALWGSRPGFGATARFTGSDDDADLLVGPVERRQAGAARLYQGMDDRDSGCDSPRGPESGGTRHGREPPAT